MVYNFSGCNCVNLNQYKTLNLTLKFLVDLMLANVFELNLSICMNIDIIFSNLT